MMRTIVGVLIITIVRVPDVFSAYARRNVALPVLNATRSLNATAAVPRNGRRRTQADNAWPQVPDGCNVLTGKPRP